jgi:hypothetical protein
MDFISSTSNTPSRVLLKSNKSTIFGLHIKDIMIIIIIIIVFGYAYKYVTKE